MVFSPNPSLATRRPTCSSLSKKNRSPSARSLAFGSQIKHEGVQGCLEIGPVPRNQGLRHAAHLPVTQASAPRRLGPSQLSSNVPHIQAETHAEHLRTAEQDRRRGGNLPDEEKARPAHALLTWPKLARQTLRKLKRLRVRGGKLRE